MKVLAVECCGDALSMALSDGGALWRLRRGGGRHDEKLWPALRALLARARLELRDVEAVACCSGPARFTGVRVGMTFAQALASSLGVPCVALSLLEAAAHRLRREGAPARFVVALPAGRADKQTDELYAQGAGAPVYIGPGQAAAVLAGLSRGGRDPVLRPGPLSAEDLIPPALERLRRGKPGACAPLYLKPASFEPRPGR